MARVMGTLRDNEFITQLTLRLKEQRKREINPSWIDFKNVRFTDSHSSRLDGTKLSAHTMTNSQMKIIHTLCTAEEHNRRETSWVLILNSQGRNGRMKQRGDNAEAIKIKERLDKESGGKNTKIHPSKQVRQRSELTVLKIQ